MNTETLQKEPGETAAPGPRAVIDTSNMNEAQRAALELTEGARELVRRSFLGSLFMGDFDLARLHPYPLQDTPDRDQGNAFIERLDNVLRQHVNPDTIDAEGEIPDVVIDKLREIGAFGIKIPASYGGLGLSQTNYCRAAERLGSYCANLAALISAHQSIGVPQPLLMFGTEEQKRRFLPRAAGGVISAFALTETGAGSDPASMTTHAEPGADGAHYILNGEKLWCTNGTKAGIIIVMARTPDKVVHGKPRRQITAFLLDMDTPGVEVVRRCHFMGLRALYNGVIRFTNVRVPASNIVLAEGRGLRVALSTLNTGRLTLPAACTGLAKRCLRISRQWAASREQWGAPIGRHAAIGDKLARMAANTFAMEAMTHYTASLVDAGPGADIRLEAAACKMWATERAWEIVNDTMQIRGGRGYETAQSLSARGEEGIPVERMLRDCRINTIFEGSSEIMRLFIAREAMDPHLSLAGPMLNSRASRSERLASAARALGFYALWYPAKWLPCFSGLDDLPSDIVDHLHYARTSSRRLARALFHAMAAHGPALEKRQLILGRLVEIGVDLFALSTACSRTAAIAKGDPDRGAEAADLVDVLYNEVRIRIEDNFRTLRQNHDKLSHRISGGVLEGRFAWLEDGIFV